jgi:hypothetical protein
VQQSYIRTKSTKYKENLQPADHEMFHQRDALSSV